MELNLSLKFLIILNGATVFAYEVNNPKEYGVIEFDNGGVAVSLEENLKYQKAHMRYLEYICMIIVF